jgi:hypothetical protein
VAFDTYCFLFLFESTFDVVFIFGYLLFVFYLAKVAAPTTTGLDGSACWDGCSAAPVAHGR